ncbi:1609_t:CDS:2 [Acaulospora colombiana]|uniref:1609_t:CDS:1 n=1 Tax=Acaulospora colombiana TaxID=27376 RepID=A0ACA9NYF0_9GLOM|nr:1609_t:CDS:2 [Acaulospora colombiana]
MASLSTDGLMPPLVVRNKRGRKVDETLPKSHQREVQRQFRARRAGHLLDLERRVSLLERENIILRQMARVRPSDRYLLGRGPTGCDTAKPLIADENDPEIHIVPESAYPRDGPWSSTSTSAPSHHLPVGKPNQAISGGVITPTAAPPSSTAVPAFEKSGYDQIPYPDVSKYKPHPLYDQHKLLEQPAGLTPYEHGSSALATDRHQTPRPEISPAHSTPYYTIPHRASFSRPGDSYGHPDVTAGHQSSYHTGLPPWNDNYGSTSIVNRRPVPLTPIITPGGISSNTGANSSPSSQAASNATPVTDSRPQTMSSDPLYGAHRQPTASSYSHHAYPGTSSTPAPASSAYMTPTSQVPASGINMYPAHLDPASHDSQDSFRQ